MSDFFCKKFVFVKNMLYYCTKFQSKSLCFCSAIILKYNLRKRNRWNLHGNNYASVHFRSARKPEALPDCCFVKSCLSRYFCHLPFLVQKNLISLFGCFFSDLFSLCFVCSLTDENWQQDCINCTVFYSLPGLFCFPAFDSKPQDSQVGKKSCTACATAGIPE